MLIILEFNPPLFSPCIYKEKCLVDMDNTTIKGGKGLHPSRLCSLRTQLWTAANHSGAAEYTFQPADGTAKRPAGAARRCTYNRRRGAAGCHNNRPRPIYRPAYRSANGRTYRRAHRRTYRLADRSANRPGRHKTRLRAGSASQQHNTKDQNQQRLLHNRLLSF